MRPSVTPTLSGRCDQQRRGLERADADDCADRRSLRGASRCHQWPLGSGPSATSTCTRPVSARHLPILAGQPGGTCQRVRTSPTRPIQWRFGGDWWRHTHTGTSGVAILTCWEALLQPAQCDFWPTRHLPNIFWSGSTPPDRSFQRRHQHLQHANTWRTLLCQRWWVATQPPPPAITALESPRLQAHRYFNLHECQFADKAPTKHLHGQVDTLARSVPAPISRTRHAVAHSPVPATAEGSLAGQIGTSGVASPRLLDTTHGTGYIEFQMTANDLAARSRRTPT